MELHVLLAGIEFGPYSDDKARQLLGEGFLSASDPAKRTDETSWLTLSQILGDLAGNDSGKTAPSAPTFIPPPGSFGDLIEEEYAPATFDEPEAVAPEPEPEETIPAEEETFSTPVSEAAEEPFAPEIPEARTPQEPLAQQTPPSFSAPPVAGGLGAPLAAAPKLQVSVPQRGKKNAVATRTGSLLAMEALHAARDRSGILPPTRPVLATTTAPVPEFEPEPAPPRKRTPVKLGAQPAEEPTPAPQRKAIKLTGRIGIGPAHTAPQLDRIAEPERPSFSTSKPTQPPATTGPRPGFPRATTAPRLPAAELAKFSGFIARPSDAARSRTEPVPENQSGPILLRERRDTGALKSPPRKTIKLTGPVTLPGRAAGFTAPISRAPQTDLDEGPMLRERTTRPVPSFTSPESAPGRTSPLAPPRVEPLSTTKSFATPSATPFFEHPTERPDESMPTGGETSDAPSGDALTASGSLVSSGELTEKRSLKITGSLKHPSSVHPPIQLSSTSSDSGPLAAALQERSSFTPPVSLESLESSDKFSSLPADEEGITSRPPTGKIPVSEMPAEGVKVLARRLTAKVPLPASPAESLASESPARPNPPPLPRKKIELPAVAAFGAAAIEESEISQPISREEFEATPKSASFAAAAPVETPPRESSSTLPPPETAPSPDSAAKESSVATSAVDAEQVAVDRPEKVRLRRPVKLELSSRKAADSGRITLETFSKLAKPGEPAPAVPAAADPIATVPEPAPDELPSSAAEKATPPQALKSNSSLDFPKRLEETPFVARPARQGKKKDSALGLILYTIVGVGIVAAFVVAFLLWHRAATDAATQAAEIPATNNLAPPESAPPPSAAPPSSATSPGYTTTVLTPGASVPTPSVAPAPAAVVSTNAAIVVPAPPAPVTAPDLQRQSSAFVSDGILKYQHGDLDAAIAAYGQALDLDPKSSTAYFNRGIAKAAHDDLDGAIADYTQALEIDPTMAGAYYYRGLARHSKAELDGALSDYDQAVQMDPKNALAFFNRGLIRMQKDDVDGAIVDSSRAVQLDPHLIQSYYDRGLGRMAKGAMDAALTDMQAFTQQAPQDAYTDYARLYIWLIQTRAGQVAEANQELSKAMNAGWNGAPDAMVTRIGEYLLGQIGEEELIKASASAIPLKDQGQRCEAWYFVGMRQLVEGDKDAGIDSLRKCVDTQKTDYCEYILAEEQLRNLSAAGTADGGTTTPPPPPRALPVTLPDPGTIAPATAP